MFHLLLSILIMINPATLSTRLTGLIGFKQPTNPAYAILDADNLASRSGYYVNDNPFVKIESVRDSQDYAGINDLNFNIFLREKIKTSIVSVANSVFSQQDYIDRQLIYKEALNKFSQTPTADQDAQGRYVNVYNLPAGFSCYWLKPSKAKDIAFKIKRVFLEFNGTGDITLYLYNTADLTTPLFSKTVTVTKPLMEVELDWICSNTGAGYKGDYYLGYFADGMTLKPFKREYREAVLMSNISEVECLLSNFANFSSPATTFDLMGFSPYVYYNGVNPDITVYEDFTDLIIQNEKLFARAIQLDCQISMISETLASLRSNRTERVSNVYAAQLMAQIEGETGEGNVKVKGLKPLLFGAIASIRKEINKLKFGYTGEGLIKVETIS